MLKALKTLLKDDIINPNTEGGFIMGVQQALTTEQVSILLWLKTIDDFKGEGYETATFNEKYDAFEAVEDTGFTREEYDSYVGFWKRNGIIDEDKHTQEYSISKKGKKLFKQLDEMKESSDKEIEQLIKSKRFVCNTYICKKSLTGNINGYWFSITSCADSSCNIKIFIT